MKNLILSAAAFALFCPAMAAAQDIVVIDQGQDSIITGTIEDIDLRTMDVLVDGKKIRVETDDLNIDDDIENFLSVGDRVQIFGDFDNGDFEADRIVKVKNQTINVEIDSN